MRSQKKRAFKKREGKCKFCGSKRKLTIDHIIPLSKGGTGRWKNIQVLCRDCNVKKGNKILAPIEEKVIHNEMLQIPEEVR